MAVESVPELVEVVATAASGPDDLERATSALTALGRLRRWCDAQDVALTAMVSRCTPGVEDHVRAPGRLSSREARERAERARTAAELAPLGEALENGEIRGEHLDAVARARRRLEPAERARFDSAAHELAGMARQTDPATFERYVQSKAQRARVRDGEDELERQRRSARCRVYVARESGMWALHLEVDPETGLKLDSQIRSALEGAFTDGTPPTCPTDPFEKQDHLRALAVTSMLLGGTGDHAPAGPPEMIVVVDTRCTAHAASAGEDVAGGASGQEPDARHDTEPPHDTERPHDTEPLHDTHDPAPERSRRREAHPCSPSDGRPVVDWGLPVELPLSVLTDLYPRATVTTVVLCRGAVIHAPGRLHLGRTTRLANRAQRRVLRALYPGCAIPGCPVRFDHCKIHHVVWWRHGGPTDLHNLLPVCVRHHSLVHDHGWTLDLQPDRTLTVTRPDGTRLTTGPPTRRAA